MIRPAPAAVPIHYPSSDGRPMAENDAQRSAIMYGIGALNRHFKGRRDVYVSGDLLIYYREGDPRTSIAPDVFVVFGVEDRPRQNYKLWEEGQVPAFVLEVASPSTWRDDLGRQRSVYARLGVREYWQCGRTEAQDAVRQRAFPWADDGGPRPSPARRRGPSAGRRGRRAAGRRSAGRPAGRRR